MNSLSISRLKWNFNKFDNEKIMGFNFSYLYNG